MKNLILTFLCVITVIMKSDGQDFSNKGKEFWVGYGSHVGMYDGDNGAVLANGGQQQMVFYFTSDRNAKVTVNIPGLGWTRSYNVTKDQITTSDPMPKTTNQDARLTVEGKSNKGIQILSDVPIIAYAHIYNSSVSGATLLFPVNTLANDYYSINFTQNSNQPYSYCFAYVVATEDNTTVEITLGANTLSKNKGDIITVNLNKGEVYNIFGNTLPPIQIGGGPNNPNFLYRGEDLTGTRIRSTGTCKKIAVYSGSGKLDIQCLPNVAAPADNYMQQAFPASAWGKKYLTAPTKELPNNYFRVFVKDASTIVKRNGVPLTGLINNQYYEYQSVTPDLLESDQNPFMVAQYITSNNQCGNIPSAGAASRNLGDPEMIYLSPIEQTIEKVTINSTTNFNILQHFINIIIHKDGVTSLVIDGNPPASQPLIHPSDNNYVYFQVPVSAGTHTISSNIGFNAVAYGYGANESYGYNAGANVRDLNQFISINNEFPSAAGNSLTTCRDAPFNLSVTLPYQPLKLQWKFMGSTEIVDATGKVATDPLPRGDGVNLIAPDKTSQSPTNANLTLNTYNFSEIYRFKTPNDYNIKLLVSAITVNSCSGEQELDFLVKVIDLPQTTITATTSGCFEDKIDFLGTSQNDPSTTLVKHIWNIDGIITQDNQAQKSYTFLTEGSKTTTLRVVNSAGCQSASASKTILLTARPNINFTTENIPCIGKEIRFKNNSVPVGNSTIEAYEWLFDNTDPNASLNPIKIFSKGLMEVKLSGTTNSGCFNAVTKRIVVNPNPVPKLALPESCVTDISTFRGISIIDGNESMQHEWNFGDPNAPPANNVAIGNTVVHKYSAAGPYIIQLKVTSLAGCISDTSVNFKINGANPVTDFDLVQPATLCSNEELRIIDKSFVDIGDIIRVKVFWEWDAANPNASRVLVDEQPNKKIYDTSYVPFFNVSTKQITVRMMAYSGESQSCITSLEKTFQLNGSPKVSFNDIPLICQEANPRQITQASYSDVAGITPGTFSFSGTGVSNGGIFNPALSGPGTFYLKYQFTASNGCIDTLTKSISVLKSPVADFIFSDTLCEKNKLLFTSSSMSDQAGKITDYVWTFPGQQVNAVPYAEHVFPGFGSANVSLQINTENGCTNTLTKSVDIKPVPIVSFDLPVAVCLPEGRAFFKNTSGIPLGSLFSYRWNFGDPINNSSSVSEDGLHNYSKLGIYPVKLIIASKDGCVDSLTQNLETVFPQPKASIQSLDSVCIGKSIDYADNSTDLTHPAVKWYWDFGNNVKDSLKEKVKYQHPNSGKYIIKMVLQTNVGCYSDTAKKEVVIHPYPVVNAGPDLDVLDDGERLIGASATGTNLVFQWTPATYLDKTDILRPRIIKPIEDIKYKLSVTGSGGCTTIDSIWVKALKSILPPNTFTPNGDGNNDYWEIKNFNLYNFGIVEIYSAQGQFITRIKSSERWDGTQNGKPLPVGTYYYVIDPRSGRKRISGYVTILK